MKLRSKINLRTRKIVDRILYDPVKNKQKFTRELRKKLAQRSRGQQYIDLSPVTRLNVGSINVNGLDLETHVALEALIKKHDLDVSYQ